jgi:diadenosine tetraphosphate (Ap4A) HIT family hydrolase
VPESLSKFRKELISSFSPADRVRFKFVKKRRQHPNLHPECKFCQKIRAKRDIIFENAHIVVMFGRPHHKGHIVVMPKAHEEDLLKLHQKTLDSFLNDTIKIMKALGKAIRPNLFNLEYLDNWDHHVHWNIYPRFRSDPDYGNPPNIPSKNQKFKPKYLSIKELKVLESEIRKIKKELW